VDGDLGGRAALRMRLKGELAIRQIPQLVDDSVARVLLRFERFVE